MTDSAVSSRRSFLSSAATAATAIVAGCTSAALASPSPDAELIRLGAEFDRTYAAWLPCWREWERLNSLWRQTLDERGLRNERVSVISGVYAELGGDVVEAAYEEIESKLDGICHRIRSIRPQTLAGLATWAKVTRVDGFSTWVRDKPVADLDYDDRVIIEFLAMVERMAVQS